MSFFDPHANFASSTVVTAPVPAASGNSLIVVTGEGAKFPTVPFNATVWPASVLPSTANAEIVRVTLIVGDTLTVTRTQESTSARPITVGDQIAATITSKTLTDIEAQVPPWAFVALVDGATPALNAALGSVFTLLAGGDRTIAIPTNPTASPKLIIRHTASGGPRTLALNAGAGGFRFGSDITALSQTVSGKTDYIGCVWNVGAGFYDVVAYMKGY